MSFYTAIIKNIGPLNATFPSTAADVALQPLKTDRKTTSRSQATNRYTICKRPQIFERNASPVPFIICYNQDQTLRLHPV